MIKYLLFILISFELTAQVTLSQKISQMIMIGFPGKAADDTTLINDLQVRGAGGVIIFSWNIESPAQLNLLTTQLQSLSSIPLFISVDQEGGKVARLKASTGYSNTSTAFSIGAANDEFVTRNWAGLMAGWLDDANININLAPVADVNVNPLSPAIGKLERSFSHNPDTVYQHSRWFIDEFNLRNIRTALKHFPGHGSASTDSHFGFTDITNTWTDSELIPFQKLFQSGFNDFVMTGHLYNANLDSVYPASLSNKITTGLLRNTMGFNGLIITDGMFMGAITNNYSFDEAVTLAINAGNDILLYTDNKLGGKSLVDSIVNIVTDKISKGIITEARINESYNRIMQMKQTIADVPLAENIQPGEYELINYPNPFNASTNINVQIPVQGILSIKIYNVVGEEVADIFYGEKPAGTHKFFFNGDNLSSGVYLVRMSMADVQLSHKIILLK